MDANARQSLENFLNPELMRTRLICASIYIAAFESLKDAIVGRIRDFFWRGFDESGDEIDPKYQSDVLSRNKSPIYASLGWLREMQAVNDADISSFDRVKACRNILAHRLLATLDSDGMPTDFEKCFREMVDLLHKVELWWIKEFEIPVNPDLDGKDIDESSIIPGRVMGIQLMCDVALGDEKTSGGYLNELQRQMKGG